MYIRILEACNANCEMCGFALSRERYRFLASQLKILLPQAVAEGIKYIRFTGGEPLIHQDIVQMVRIASEHGLRSSIITNGLLLRKRLGALREAGLEQVIVSIDGATNATHDRIRRTPGLFNEAIAGLRESLQHEIHCRVNTVCGPNNFREMPRLQDMLTELEVDQWELSSLKIERRLDYHSEDIADLDGVVNYVYYDAALRRRLVPLGKVWCGDTPLERQRYISTGIPPLPDHRCHVVNKVRYLDARHQLLFPCSLLPHRHQASQTGAPMTDWSQLPFQSDAMRAIVFRFHDLGPHICTGCSSTAAGYSNDLEKGQALEAWSF